jgi:hypothetical protein
VHKLRTEVERWSSTLRRDSSVAVVFLGDNVYPAGLRTGTPYFPEDSAHLQAQVNILAGPAARQYESFGIFIAGNHDWGNKPGASGTARLKNQQDFFMRRRPSINVSLMPDAGMPGPGYVDIGRQIRILFIDTAWWLLTADREEKARTISRLHSEMEGAQNRDVIIASHHPYRSASSHGGVVSPTAMFGIDWLLNRTGATLQDLNSLPYRDFITNIDNVFKATRPPLIYIGGHDHSLQVMEATTETDPRSIVVSGAGSKTSPVGDQSGMVYRSGDAGYTQVVTRRGGHVDLYVYAMPYDESYCETGDVAACMAKGEANITMRYSATLK